ncbi:MAG: flagellar hook-length control protein FliK [Roseibium sp.]|uniref:flagellar hook-length control protein FliK n=1 Tax=Roseibium sp. TaxID=1936156 RepID=UPI0032973BCC
MPGTPAPGTTPASQTAASASAAAGASQKAAAVPAGPGVSPGATQTRPSAAGAYPQLAGSAVSTPSAGSVAAAGSQGPASGIAGGLQQALSEQQAGLTGLFAQVGSLMSAQSAGKVAMPDTVVKAMQQILGLRLNASSPPTATGLQQAVRLSGQFREAQLAQPGSTSAGMPDLKTALLSFKSLLQQLGARSEIVRPAGQPPAPSRHTSPQGQPPQPSGGYWAGAAPQNLQALLKETNSALARLRITQLTNTGLTQDSGPQSASRPMDLVLELPLALGQETAMMQMQVGRDGAGNQEDGEEDPAWRLRFALDLTATGPLEAAVSLRGGGTYASLWVDRKETFDMLNAVRDTMEAAFVDAGLDLQELRLIRGLPPKTAALSGARVDRQS